MTVPTVPDERTALRARQAQLLRDPDVLDAAEDAELAAVVRVAAAVTGLPHATVNLLDTCWQHQLVTHGFAGSSTPRGRGVARALVTRIERTLGTPADGGPALRSSTGIAVSRRGDTADDPLRRGDAAMHEVKRSRR